VNLSLLALRAARQVRQRDVSSIDSDIAIKHNLFDILCVYYSVGGYSVCVLFCRERTQTCRAEGRE
jgi:hypothetical protein